MITAFVLFLIGLGLSAFFSGSEIGYYRATRIRLTMDASEGLWINRGLMWLANNPVMFVATTLVGNNMANYLVSYAVIAATREVMQSEVFLVELFMPIAFSPIVFIYGELLPKKLFFQAPNRLLRTGAPFFLFCCLLFSPIAGILWLLGRFLTLFVGRAPEKLHASLARKELQRLFDEGEYEGVLRPAQRELAQTIFTFTNQSLEKLCEPISRATAVHLGTPKQEVYRLAHRKKEPNILISEEKGHKILGYARVVDLYLEPGSDVNKVQPLLEFPKSTSPLTALMKMQSEKESIAKVVDDQQKPIGLISARALSDIVWNERDTLHQ